MRTEAGQAFHGLMLHSEEPCHLATTIELIEAQAARLERERLAQAFSEYEDWLVQQTIYGRGGGWGEAVLLKVSTMLGER